MERVPEPELMEDPDQARAYAEADFEQPHNTFVELFAARFPALPAQGRVLDLGCGPADIVCRFARAYPRCAIDGVDGSAAMLALGQKALIAAGLEERVRLLQAVLPGAELPEPGYAVVISNSLLHHLGDPGVLWQAVRRWGRPGAPVFIMDLCRPDSRAETEALVKAYAAGEPEVLRHDFYHSLLAAYRPDEVRAQLAAAGLALQVEQVSDRHLIAWGHVEG